MDLLQVMGYNASSREEKMELLLEAMQLLLVGVGIFGVWLLLQWGTKPRPPTEETEEQPLPARKRRPCRHEGFNRLAHDSCFICGEKAENIPDKNR